MPVLSLAGCGGGDDEPPAQAESAAPSVTKSETAEPTIPAPTLEESVELPSRGYALAIECWGSGSPTVLLDAGSNDSGTTAFSDELMQSVAAGGTACTYDRLGTGESDAAPKQDRRFLRDLSKDLDALLAEADVPKPYVLVGSSFGGFVVLDYAEAFPENAGAIVLLDVPAPQGELTAKEAPDAAWDHPENIERVDALAAEHSLAARKPVIPSIPLRVVTATFGQSNRKDQSYWMSLSPKSESVVLEGGHVIYMDDPEGVIREIRKAAEALR